MQLIFIGIGVLLAMLEMFLLRHDVAGDTYIHLTFARNLATGHGFSYNRDERSNGSSSPLWTMILAIMYRIMGPTSVLDASRLLAGVFHFATAILLYRIIDDVVVGDFAPAFVTIIWLTNPNAIDWSMRAMETSIFIFLLLLSCSLLGFFLQAPALPIGFLVGLVFGLLVLTRPEGWIWVGGNLILILWKVLFAIPTGALSLGAILLGSLAVTVLPYYVWMLYHFGTIFPTSRARLFHHRQFARNIGPFRANPVAARLLFVNGIYYSLLPLMCIGLSVIITDGQSDSLQHVILLPVFGLILLLFFTYVVPGIDYGYRYILPAMPPLLVLVGIGSDVLFGNLSYHIAFGISVFLLGAVARESWLEFDRARSFMRSYILGQQEPVRESIAAWTREFLPADAIIAAKEIDRLAYHSKPGQRILSMDGTIGGEVLPYLQSGDFLEFLKKHKATHLLIEGNIYTYYPFWSKSQLAPLAGGNAVLGEIRQIDGVSFSLLHEESFFPYADMHGNLRADLCHWRIYSITSCES